MGHLIDDEMLTTFAVVCPIEELADKVRNRYGGVVDRVMLSLPMSTSEEAATSVLNAWRDGS